MNSATYQAKALSFLFSLGLMRTGSDLRALIFIGKVRAEQSAMSKSLKIQITENARALIQDEAHWCRGELARDPGGLSVDSTSTGAIRHCALGALVSAAHQPTDNHRQAYDLAINALRPTCGSATLVRVNDTRGHAAVLALIDEALASM